MLKIYSWNVNGIRAVLRKNEFVPFVEREQPDILCLQETKAKPEQVGERGLPEGYEQYWYSAEKPGYSGTALFTKIKPRQIVNGFPEHIIKEFKVTGDTYGSPNQEGRVIAAEFEKFWLVTVYTPNAKEDLTRLDLRAKHWDPAFLAYCKELETGGSSLCKVSPCKGCKVRPCKGKPVVSCGDLNVAHTENDLANPKPNMGKKGFTDEERAGFQNFIDHGFVDTLRLFHQGNGYYTWWSHFANARARNVGWRIDYILASQSLKSKIKAAEIHPKIQGSAHCPVSLTLDP